jgi:hypothetical protein
MQTSIIMFNGRTNPVCNPASEEIARVAYHLYLEQGAQHGYELDDWLRAEQLVLQQLNETHAPGSSS